MGKAGRNKRARDRRPGKSSKQPGEAKAVFSEIEKVAAVAGIAPEWVYAMRKTGMMVVAANLDQWSKEDLAKWAAAVEEYHSRKPQV